MKYAKVNCGRLTPAGDAWRGGAWRSQALIRGLQEGQGAKGTTWASTHMAGAGQRAKSLTSETPHASGIREKAGFIQ